MRNAARFLPLALLAATPAVAQQKEPTTYDRAIAAGYKALTLCSGMFNAGRTQAQVEALELTGIYPEYDKIVPTLTATIDPTRKYVEVPFDGKLPPRTAQWTPWAGCHILPIGYPIGFHPVPSPPPRVRQLGTQDAAPWPMGESGIPPLAEKSRVADLIATSFGDAAYGKGTRTTAALVVRNGKIVAERYADGFDAHTSQRTWSVAKSLTGTLIGRLAQQGGIDVSKPAMIPAWQNNGDPRSTITVDNLLRMASGLHSSTAGNRTDAIYFGGTGVAEEATAWPIDALPGTRFRYANNDILLAMLAGKRSSEKASLGFWPDTLFDKIGMTRTIAEQDWRYDYVSSSQVWSTARDLARFGLLYLNDGVWNGERLLPGGWVKYVTTPSGPQPPEGDFGYGASFWLLNRSPGVPADTFAAFGNRGQYVVIVPSRKVVIVRRAEDPAGARFDIAKFTADVLAALK